jgi:hypothetical protein
MIKIAGGYKKFGLGDERFLHAQSYQILPPLGILKLCGGLKEYVMKNIVFVTDAESLPIDYDMDPLVTACADFDLPIEIRKWDDPTVNWAAFDLVVLRSP